jgi:hypothetical protein
MHGSVAVSLIHTVSIRYTIGILMELLTSWSVAMSQRTSRRKGVNMTIQYKTTELIKALDYIRIHQRDGYFVSAYKSGIDYIVRVSGVEEVKDEPQTDKWSVEYAKEMLNTMPCEDCGHWEHGAGDHYYCALLAMRQECCFESKDESTLMFANEPQTDPQTDCQWK